MKSKLFVTRELFPDVIDRLRKYYEVEVWIDTVTTI